jgi:hypothetical protein
LRSGIGTRVLFALVLSVLAVAACNGGSAGVAPSGPAATPPTPMVSAPASNPVVTVPTPLPTLTTAPTPTLAPPPTPSPTASPSVGPGGSATPTAIDPCTLLTTDEASAVNGVNYPAGTSHALENGAVECVWQTSSPPASVTVQLAILPTATEAQIAYTMAVAATKVQVETLSGFADDAAIARVSTHGLSTGGIYVHDGVTFFDVVYVEGTVPTDDQLKYAATLVLGSLP